MKTSASSSNLFLIGPMGSGKTSASQHLAKLTGLLAYDSDQEVERHAGVDIPWIFEVEGESGFRERETKVIDELTQRQHIILSTGGGSILSKNNREYLSERGIVVYLKVSLEEQLIRTKSRGSARPLLSAGSPEEKLRELNRIRNPLYESIADIKIETDGLSPMQLARTIFLNVQNLEAE